MFWSDNKIFETDELEEAFNNGSHMEYQSTDLELVGIVIVYRFIVKRCYKVSIFLTILSTTRYIAEAILYIGNHPIQKS